MGAHIASNTLTTITNRCRCICTVGAVTTCNAAQTINPLHTERRIEGTP